MRYFREIYLALRDAAACDQSIRGISATRLLMVELFGVDRQAQLIEEWNKVPARPVPLTGTPQGVKRLAEEGIQLLWVKSGLPFDMSVRLAHLFPTMLDIIFGDREPDDELWAQSDELLASNPADYSNARIIGNMVLAADLWIGHPDQIRATAERIRGILVQWRLSGCVYGDRESEEEELSWIIEHADNFALWASDFRFYLSHTL